ncbi:hypothetical protein [Streptomyces sp. NPDC001568]
MPVATALPAVRAAVAAAFAVPGSTACCRRVTPMSWSGSWVPGRFAR